MKVRMIVIPSGGQTTISEITQAEASAIMRGALMRQGHVTVENIEGGYKITDGGGQTLLSAIGEG